MTTTTISAPLKKRGLGANRGLSFLLSGSGIDPQEVVPKSEEKTTTLSLEKLKPGKYQPRHTFTSDSLQELADSIRAQGIIQPVIVRKTTGTDYEIIAGERRCRAAKLAGLTEVPVIIRDVDDNAVIAMALIENIQRENLNALEEARALKRLQDEFQLTQLEVAEAIGKSRVAVTHTLSLLNLHSALQQYLEENILDKGHAKALASLSLSEQAKAAMIVVQKGLSVRETEKLVKQWAENKYTSSPGTSPRDPNISALEKNLSEHFNTTVTLQHSKNKKGPGKLVIHYRNLDSLDDILKKLKK